MSVKHVAFQQEDELQLFLLLLSGQCQGAAASYSWLWQSKQICQLHHSSFAKAEEGERAETRGINKTRKSLPGRKN